MESILIFIPQQFDNTKSEYIYGKAVYNDSTKVKKFYIIDTYQRNIKNDRGSDIYPIGQCSTAEHKPKSSDRTNPDWIILKCVLSDNRIDLDYCIESIIINNRKIVLTSCHVVLIIYDKIALQETESFIDKSAGKDHFFELMNILKNESTVCENPKPRISHLNRFRIALISLCLHLVVFLSSITNQLLPILKYSSLGLHLHEWLENMKWMLLTVQRSEKFTLKTGNYFMAVVLDVLLGILALRFLLYSIKNTTPSEMLLTNAEKVVEFLITLINWLMGVPAGLKLNYAFNKMLGKFFLHHIHLWWTILTFIRPVMNFAFDVLSVFGGLGITFQLSIAVDLLTLVSFHSYCIYVYAARLFNIQLQGITALSRLFLGKKKNPLRSRVDSCEYQPDQLFVGTLLFTILLFLMPTTWVYYTVFTMLRLILLGFNNLLCQLKYYLQIMPMYSLFKWLFRSHSACSNIDIHIHKRQTSGPITLKMNLIVSTWSETFKTCIPDIISPNLCIEWQKIINSLIWGKLLYPI